MSPLADDPHFEIVTDPERERLIGRMIAAATSPDELTAAISDAEAWAQAHPDDEHFAWELELAREQAEDSTSR